MSTRISACLLARDEQEAFSRCLDALHWVDEIVVVVDSRSGDDSEKVARERADRVEVRAYEGDIEQKRYCVSLASSPWVLIVDPDEVVTAELAGAIREAVEGGAGHAGYEIDRITHHLGRWIEHGDFHPDWCLRVFRPARAHWVSRNPHGRIVVDGTVGRLTGRLEHYSYRDLADQIDRIQLFSDQAAAALFAEGRRARLSDLVLRPPARFLRAYVLKRGFLDGVAGFVIAAATAFHVCLKYAKLWELEHRPSPSPGQEVP